ncbi:Pyridoxine 5'-phosphate synthase, partial [Bienertia sinuspersici]
IFKKQKTTRICYQEPKSHIQPFNSDYVLFSVAKRTHAQLFEHARHTPLPLSDSSSSEEESEENFEMANPARMLKELAAPRFNPDLLCVTYDDDEAECEIRPGPPQIQQEQQPQSGGMSLEEINLENQVSQLANTVGRLEAQNSHKLPSQPESKGECKCHFFKKWKGIRRTAC